MADDKNGVVIVAIPNEDDYTWKTSSEKIPHMTLLFLGNDVDGPTLAHIESFLSHAVADTLTRFSMSVDHRGELGPDDADVVFFNKSDFDLDKIKAFRTNLLKDDRIAALYNSADQFPSWTPHLTLGYPTAPAKPDDRDYPGISWVGFDKIALWVGDFTGPEFLIPRDDAEAAVPEISKVSEVAMSDNLTAFLTANAAVSVEELAHHGVKGMKWGVRRSDNELASAAAVRTHGIKGKLREAVARVTGRGGGGSGSATKTEDKPAEDAAHISEDAVKFIKSTQKSSVSLSDQEIREAVNRANMVKQYDQIFKPDANSTLQAKVTALNLQKQYAQLHRELNPTKTQRVLAFAKTAESGFKTYQTLDKVTGGTLSDQVRKALGLPKTRVSRDATLSKEVKSLSLEAKHRKLMKELADSGIHPGQHNLDSIPGKHRR